MNLYKINYKEDFFTEVTNYVIANFKHNLIDLKIILPSGYECSHLQKCLISRIGTSLLPKIITISEVSAENEEVFQIPSQQFVAASSLEEKFWLAEIIHSYEKLGYNLQHAIALSQELAFLFNELEANEISLQQVKEVPNIDQSKHWDFIYDFLHFAKQKWQDKLSISSKLSKAKYQQLMFTAEIERLTNNQDQSLLIAGISGGNLLLKKFCKSVVNLPNGHIILPPTAGVTELNDIRPDDGLFAIAELLKTLEKKLTDFTVLGSYKAGILDNLLQPTTNISLTDKPLGMDIKYIEFDNNISEAEFIAANCRHYIDNNPEANIAIIINSSKAKEYYSNCLSKYLLQYNDLIGEDILKLGAVYLLTEVAKLICDEFHLQRFFSLLSDPLVNSVLVDKLKNTIIKNNRFINSYAEIKELVAKEGNQEVINYFTELSNGLDIEFKDRSFNNILKQVIKTTEAIYPKIWQENDCYKLSESLLEILKINWQWQIQDLAEFPEILRAILKGGRVYSPVEDTRITLCKPADVALVNFDLVMMADLNEGSLPANASNNPWLNKHMQEELSIHSWCAKFGSGLYNFYLNLHNKEVVITRAKKQVNNKLSLISTFMLRLKHILGSKLKIENIAVNSSRHLTEENENEKYITVDAFPEYVSATDVELLLRSPYNFYAKKILKLRPEVEIEEKPSLAEFGNFFHNVVDLYNKNYAEENGYGVECLLSIANDILENSIFPEYIKKNWKIKLTAIAPEFIEFDEERRKIVMETYSEIKGKMMLNIAGKDIVVTSIADRIEIDENREAVIIDYKTGAMPSKSEVASGLSPQLVIAALILLQGGFGIEITGIKSLLYVKINHNEPYIKTQAITLTAEELAQHKQGLISLLEYYVNNKIFPVKQAELEYDDYSHLARR